VENGNVRNPAIDLRRDYGGTQKMRGGAVIKDRRSDLRILKGDRVLPAIAPARLISPWKLAGIERHGARCLNGPRMRADGAAREELAGPRGDRGCDQQQKRRIGVQADDEPVGQRDLSGRAVGPGHENRGDEHMLPRSEREFVSIEVPVLRIAEIRAAAKGHAVEKEPIPLVGGDMEPRGGGLFNGEAAAEGHLSRRRHSERGLDPPGGPGEDQLTERGGPAVNGKGVGLQ